MNRKDLTKTVVMISNRNKYYGHYLVLTIILIGRACTVYNIILYKIQIQVYKIQEKFPLVESQ